MSRSEQGITPPSEVVRPEQPSNTVSQPPLRDTAIPSPTEPYRLGRRALVAGGVLTAIGSAFLPRQDGSVSAAPISGDTRPNAAPATLNSDAPAVLRRDPSDSFYDRADASQGVHVITMENPKGGVTELQHFGGAESFATLKEAAAAKYANVGIPSPEARRTLETSFSGYAVVREADRALEAAADGGFDLNNQHVSEPFATYWKDHGALAQQGLPISPMYNETNPTNNQEYGTQYFERARFENHLEFAGTPNQVLLGLLGREQYKGKYKDAPAPNEAAYGGTDKTVFKETGKSVNPDFMKYWLGNGGLAQQGLPVSEQFMERSPFDGKEYLVQYFERARFELHPENKPPYDVLLGLLGVEQHGNPKESPPNPNPEQQPHFPPATRTESRKSTVIYWDGKPSNPWNDELALGTVRNYDQDKDFNGYSGLQARIISIDQANQSVVVDIGKGDRLTVKVPNQPEGEKSTHRLFLTNLKLGVPVNEMYQFGGNIYDLEGADPAKNIKGDAIVIFPKNRTDAAKRSGAIDDVYGFQHWQ